MKAYSYIRWSHPEQTKGDSLRRQLEATKEYCQENGLVLDESLNLTDKGRSGFYKDNIHKGRLGEFLRRIKAGKIEKGSVLIIENLDRLTRTQVGDAQEILRSILKEDVDVVTLTDKHRYTKASLNNPLELMLSIMTFYRSHDESLQKARRIRKAWDHKRTKLAHEKMTARGPQWLSFDRTKKVFVIREDAANTVRRIFDLSYNGMGAKSIAKTLNEKGVKNFAKKTDWQGSYIMKILSNRAVIGEYQPFTHQRTEDAKTGELNKRRVPIGEPVKHYYPAVIKAELFDAVQSRKRNRRCAVGRLYPSKESGKPAVIRNLFTGIIRCGYCDGSMVFVDKGRKSNLCLVCDNARRGLGCKYVGYPYAEFESSFLKYCQEINLNDFMERDSSSEIVSDIDKAESELNRITKAIEQMVEGMDQAGVRPTAVIRKIAELEQSQEIKREALKRLRELEADFKSESNRIKSLQELTVRLQTGTPLALNEIRHGLRERIRGLVDHVTVFPYRTEPLFGEMPVEETPKMSQSTYERQRRFFRIFFRGLDGYRHVASGPSGDFIGSVRLKKAYGRK